MTKNPVKVVKTVVDRIATKVRHKRIDDVVRKLCEENPGYTPSKSFVDALKEDSFTDETLLAYARAMDDDRTTT